MLTVVKSQYANLVEKIPAGQYYRSVLAAQNVRSAPLFCPKCGVKMSSLAYPGDLQELQVLKSSLPNQSICRSVGWSVG